jgi:glycosyltransferase involved in cell wall biosynthesis
VKISIITVCINSLKTIEKTFQSIKNQSYQNIEYIVVDGGSSDDTLKIIKNYSSCISNYISESDKGLYDAMNKGISMATEDIIGILNSGDIFLNMFALEKIAKFQQENDIDASIGNITQFTESRRKVRKYSYKN